MEHGHGRSISITMIMPSSVTKSMAEFDFLAAFFLAGFIARENVDLPYFGGPWTDYQCHSETTGN